MALLSEYDFEIPKELIACYPLEKRSSSRLLVYGKNKNIVHEQFNRIEKYFSSGDVLVVNNTKVIKARIFVFKETGGKVEIFLNKQLDDKTWTALVCNLGKKKENIKLFFDLNNRENYLIVKGPSLSDEGCSVIESNICLKSYAEKKGAIPLPPYMNRNSNDEDSERYQTIFATHEGAIAAPTAGLHFDDEIISNLQKKGVKIAQITLHVGLGTFLPIKSENINEHKMHEETFFMDEKCAQILNECRNNNKKIVAVGSTSLRVLEQVSSLNDGAFVACEGTTSIFIKPGYKFLGAQGIITNFHLPKSTLFLLICAIVGKEEAMKIYQEAIEKKYRFYSYGDACYFEINQ